MTLITTYPAPAPVLAPAALADLEVTATSEEWLKKLRALGAGVSSRPPIPILGCVLIECRQGKATVSAYDYETSAVAKLQHEPKGRLKDARALLPISWLVRTIRAITVRQPKALVTLAAKEMLGQRLLTVSSEGYTIPIVNHFNVDEYPALPEHAAYESFKLDRRTLVSALNRSLVTASTDDTLPILTGIDLLGGGKHLRIQATDRYRLSSERIVSKQELPDFRFLLKSRVWKGISRHLDGDKVTVGVLVSTDQPGRSGGQTSLSLSSGDLTYTLEGVGGEYPKIEGLFVDKAERFIEADRRALMDQVGVAVQLNERNTPCTVVMSDSSITVRPSMPEVEAIATPELAATVSNAADWADNPAVAYNPHYLLEALQTIDAEKVRLSFTTLPKPLCLTGGGIPCGTKNTYRHLIMPVRMPERLVTS
jgi:DNA polymerase-3 subunit beta